MYPDELRADLQRFYNLNIDEMGAGFSCSHAAACAAHLPLGSNVLARIDPKYSWTATDYRLFDIMCWLAGKRLPYPWEKQETLPEFGSMPAEDIDAWLAQDWRDVDVR